MDTTYNLRGHQINKDMKAIALSHPEALDYEPLSNSVLISYAGYDRGQMATPMPDSVKNRYKAVLELPIDDIDQKSGKIRAMFDRLYSDNNYHIFDEDDFKKTHDFIEKYKDSHFVVHCDAGVSRSSATALAIAKELAPEDYQKLLNLGIYFPNVLIYSYLVEGKFNDKLYKKYSKQLHPWGLF